MNLSLDQPPRELLGSLKIPPGKYIWSLTGYSRPELKVTVDESESFKHFCSICIPRKEPDVSKDRDVCRIFRPRKKVQVKIENSVHACNYSRLVNPKITLKITIPNPKHSCF